MLATSAPLPTTNPNLRNVQIGTEHTFEVVPEFTDLGSKVSSERGVARKDAGCQPVFLQSEKSVHLKEPVTTDKTGII